MYEGCNLTKEESKLLILSFTLRHSLSNLGLSHLLQLIDCHLPHVQYKSKYLLCKDLETPVPVRKIYYCQDCETNILEFEDNIDISQHLKQQYDKENDVISGKVYRKLIDTHVISNGHHFAWNTDDVQTHKGIHVSLSK